MTISPENQFYIITGFGLSEWVIWISLFAIQLVVSLLLSKIARRPARHNLIWLAILSPLMLAASIFGGFDLDSRQFVSVFGSATVDPGTVMLFIAVPWMLASLLVNTLPAFGISLASGFLFGIFISHNIFSPLEFGFYFLVFSALSKHNLSINRDDKKEILVKAVLSLIIILPLSFLIFVLSLPGESSARLVTALSGFFSHIIPLSISIFIAGVIIQLLFLLLQKHLTIIKADVRSLSFGSRRWLYAASCLGFIFLLVISTWVFLFDQVVSPRSIVVLAIVTAISVTMAILFWSYGIRVNQQVKTALDEIQKIRNGDLLNAFVEPAARKKRSELEKNIQLLKSEIHLNKTIRDRIISLDPGLNAKMEFENTLSSILRSVYDEKTSSVRIILFERDQDQVNFDRLTRMGLGVQNKLYAYLDKLLVEKLENQNPLILSDLKIDQVFNLKQGMPFPASLIAMRIDKDNAYLGVIWAGYAEVRWFDEEEIGLFTLLCQRAANLLSIIQTTKSLRSNSEKLKRILDALPEQIVTLDKDGNVKFQNTSAENSKILARDPQKAALDRELIQLVTDLDGEPISKSIRLSTNQRIHVDAATLGDDRQEYERLLVVRDTEGPSGQETEREIVATVSHGLRLPLSKMKGYVSLLQNIGSLSEQQESYINRLHAEMEGMQKLIDNILNMERLDSQEPIRPSRFLLSDFCREIEKNIELQANRKRIKFNLQNSCSQDQEIEAEQPLLQQAIINMLDNAIKFSPMNTMVSLEVKRSGDLVQFITLDQGQGIAPLDVARVFDRYFHVKASFDGQSRGIGLGLAIVKSIAEKHSGRVWVTSQLGKGSTFYFEIPVRQRNLLSE